MKELEIVIKPEKLENLKRILDSEGARGVMITTIVEGIINKVLEELNTNSFGDGKIFIKDIEGAVKIRTGETGNDAL